jgi:IclR family acetate operon transcriptional repressor
MANDPVTSLPEPAITTPSSLLPAAIPPQPMPPVDIITRPAPAAAPPRSGQTIAAVERALDVLLLFGEDEHDDLGVTEVASLLHMSKAAVHRVLSSLRSRGLVTLDPSTHRYSLGASALALGRAFLDRLDVRTLALAELHELSDLTGETALLSVRSLNHLLFVEQVMPSRELRLEAPIGHPIKLHVGSTGHMFLAGLHPDDLAEYLSHAASDPASPMTQDELDILMAKLEVTSAQRWAFSDSERQAGTASVSVPVLDHREDTVAVLTVGGPSDRIRNRRQFIADSLVQVGERVSGRMGWTPSGEEAQSDKPAPLPSGLTH